MSNITDALPISKKDIQLRIPDYSRRVILRSRNASIPQTFQSYDTAYDVPSDNPVVTVDPPVKNTLSGAWIPSGDYYRTLTAHVAGEFYVSDGDGCINVKQTPDDEYIGIPVGFGEHPGASVFVVFKGGSIQVRCNSASASIADPSVVMFVPYK